MLSKNQMDADEAHFKETGEPLFSSHMIDLSEVSIGFYFHIES